MPDTPTLTTATTATTQLNAGEPAPEGATGDSQNPSAPNLAGGGQRTGAWRSLARSLGPTNISAAYLLIGLIVLFGLWVPTTFLTRTTFTLLLQNDALTIVVALAVLLPLTVGHFDLSIGPTVGFAAILVARLNSTAQLHWSWPLALVATVLVGAFVGAVNGFLVVVVKMNSLIATLATSSVLSGLILWVSNSNQITGVSPQFQNIANHKWLGVTMPVYYMLILAAILYFVLQHTTVGRYLQATGGNAGAARLAGVRTSRYLFGSFVTCSALCALAGALITARLGTGDTSVGPPFLLPAYAGAFFGATQFARGRFNVWGTVLAVYTLAVGVQGLQLAQVGSYVEDIFNGVVLAVAVAVSMMQARHRSPSAGLWRRLRSQPNERR